MTNLASKYILPIVSLMIFTVFPTSPGICGGMPVDSTMVKTWSDPSWGQYLKIVGILAVIIVLIWLTLSVLKRLMGLQKASNGIELAGGISLGSRRSIQFVKIGSTLYLLGVTDQQVSLINIIRDPQEIESILNSRRATTQEPFSALLRKLTSKAGTAQ